MLHYAVHMQTTENIVIVGILVMNKKNLTLFSTSIR